MPWLFKDLINRGLTQFDHGQSNSKKWPKGYKDHIAPIFHSTKFKKNSQSWSRVLMMCHFQVQNSPFFLNKFFLSTNHCYYFDLPIGPFYCAKFFLWIQSFVDVQNDPFPKMRVFSENLLMSLVSFIHAYLHAKNETQILIYKWNEQFSALTWELDFSQACSFCRMLMNHNFHFTQVPDKTNDMIFLQSPKTMFLDHFRSFLHNGNFFQKIRLSHTTIYGPLTSC